MRIHPALVLLSFCLLALYQTQADPVTYTFTNITVPGGRAVQATGINNNGQIVGGYDDANGSHGFINTNGQVTSFSVPGAISTTFNAINDLGQIAGSYSTNYSDSHAFLDTNGTINVIDVPGSLLQINGINNAGQVVGSTLRSTTIANSEIGFLYANGVVTTIQVPGSIDTYASGINNLGQIVGGFSDATGAHEFLYANGVFTSFDAPASVGTSIYPSGINDSGVIVGTANLGSSYPVLENIFVDNNGVFTVLRSAYYPISHGIPFVTGNINNADQFVGSYGIPSYTGPGFLATPTTIPEPALLPMLAAGLAVLAAVVRRKRTAG